MAESKGAQAGHQGARRGSCASLWRPLGIAVATLALSGCSGLPGFIHRQEGGEIAKPQQPPPGAEKPYPNLASVPPRPAAPDAASLKQLSQSLIADRENAHHLLEPTPDPSLPNTAPGLFGVGTAPPPAPAPHPATASASLAAVSGPAPAAASAAPGSSASRSAAAPIVQPPAPPPTIPPGPPAPPRVASLTPQPGPGPTPFPNADYGGAPPGAATAAHSPAQPPFGAQAAPAIPTGISPTPPASRARITPPAPGPRLPANPAVEVTVAFPAGSAILPGEAVSALKALVARRGGHAIAVVGHGDATALAPSAQSTAVGLGLQRAEAIAQALSADGVPENAIRIGSEAEGRGGVARILE